MLPLDFPSTEDIAARGYQYQPVKIWKDTPRALNMERELLPELAPYLGVEHRLGLFRMDPANRRDVFRCAPQKEALGYQPVIDFHDSVRARCAAPSRPVPLALTSRSTPCICSASPAYVTWSPRYKKISQSKDLMCAGSVAIS